MTFPDTQQLLTEAERLGAAGRYQAALDLLDTLPSSAEDPVRAGLLRGRILVQQGQFEAAIEHWRVVQSIQPDNPEVQQALDLALRMKEDPSRSILLRANLHLAIQYGVILLLGIALLFQAFRTPSPTGTLVEQQQAMLQLQEQQARQASERMETVLRYFHQEHERTLNALAKRIDGLEQAINAIGAAVASAKTDPEASSRLLLERFAALEQAVALERESVRALGARQEERITALGMVIGEIGAHISSAPPHTSQTPVSPAH